MLERAKHILMVLELTEFRWTINDVLAQPDQELAAIIYLKSMGNKIRIQRQKANAKED